MAGGFLSDEFQSTNNMGSFDILQKAQSRRSDPLRWVKAFEALDEQERRTKADQAMLAQIRSGTIGQEAPPEDGFGGLHRAEAKLAEEERLKDPAEREKWLTSRDEQIRQQESDLNRFIDETLTMQPGVDDIRRRFEIIDIEKRNIEKYKQQQAELWEDLKYTKGARGAVGDYYSLIKLQEEDAIERVGLHGGNPVPGWTAGLMKKLGLDKLFGPDETLEERLEEDDEFRTEFIKFAVDNQDAIKEILKAYQKEAEDPSILETILRNSPLTGMQETIAGLASLPAEGLSFLLGTDERGQFETEYDFNDFLANQNPVGMLFNAFGVGSYDTALRERGREMNRKVGENLADLDLEIQRQTGISPMDVMTDYPRNVIQGFGKGEYLRLIPGSQFIDAPDPATNPTKAFLYQLGFELATDPLNLIDFATPRAAKPTTILADFARDNKWLQGSRKFWLAMEGYAKEAAAIGDPKLREAYLLNKAYAEGGVGVVALKLAQDARAYEASKISKLTEPQQQAVRGLLPSIVEQTPDLQLSLQAAGEASSKAEARRYLVELATDDDVVREAVIDAADYLDDLNLRSLDFEQAYGGQTQVLDSNFGYYMTVEDPLFTQWKAANPSAKKILTGIDGRFAKEQWESAMASWERGRSDKWRDLNFEEKEAKLREIMRPLGLPDSIPIFSRDAFENIAKRAESNLPRFKERSYFEGATEVFATKGAGDELAEMVERAADEKEIEAWARTHDLTLEAAERAAVKDTLTEGKQALKKQIGKQSKEADRLAGAADDMIDLAVSGKEAKGAVRTGNKLRQMFKGAPGSAADADAAVTAWVDRVASDIGARSTRKGGTKFSRSARRRAQKAVKTFRRSYESAETRRAARQSIKQFRDDLGAIMPPELAREYNSMADDALSRFDELSEGYQAVNDPKIRGAVSTVATQAQKRAEQAAQKALKLDINTWPTDQKANYVKNIAKKQGYAPPADYADGIDVYRAANIELPEDVASLSRLATSHLSPEDMQKMMNWKRDFHGGGFVDNATAKQVGRFFDGLKVWYQRSLLSRPGSMMRDWWGQVSQALFAADGPQFLDELEDARKALGGNPKTWAKGVGKGWEAPDDVLQLMSEGVLNTTVDEATIANNFEKMAETARRAGHGKRAAVWDTLGGFERKGTIGGLLPGKAGDKVKAVTDLPLHGRVWSEQALRLATYRQAIKRGLSHEDAVVEVYKHWGKFDELTALDRTVLSRILFFWAWRRASIPITFRNLLDYPVRSKIVLTTTAMVHNQAKEAGEEIHDAAEQAGIPEWFRRMGGVITGIDDNGNADAISMGGSTYFAPTVSILNSDMMKALSHGDVEEAFWESGREVFRSSPPYFQQIAERMEEKDYFSGQSWYDETGQSTVKAPTAFYWFMSDPRKGEPNAFEKALGLSARTDQDGNLMHVTMDPKVAWMLDWIPGLSAVMQDVGSFADPRQADVETGLELPTGRRLDLSLGKGALRQAGIPKYRLHITTEQERQVQEVREALGDSLEELTGDTLIMNQYGQVMPNYKNERGKKLDADMERWRSEANLQGLGPARTRAYVQQRMIRKYMQEWRVLELNERLKALQGKARQPADLPRSIPGASNRMDKQRAIEAEREDREFRKLLGID